MSKELIENLREYADIAESGEKSHWALAMRQAAEYIRADLDKPLPEPAAKHKFKHLSDSDIAKYFHGPIPNLGTAIAFARAVLDEAIKEQE